MGRLNITISGKHLRWLTGTMAVIAVLMLMNVFYQIARHVQWRGFIAEAKAAGVAATQPADDEEEAGREEKPPRHELPAAISKRNVFQPVRPDVHGMELTGILVNTAFFKKGNDIIGINEGKESHGVKVKAINGFEVVIEYKGKEETMKLFDGNAGQWSTSPPEAPKASPGKAAKPDQPETAPTDENAKAQQAKRAAMREAMMRAEEAAREGRGRSRSPKRMKVKRNPDGSIELEQVD